MNIRKCRLSGAVILFFVITMFAACSSDDDPPTSPPPGGTGGENPVLTGIWPPGAGIGVKARIMGTGFGTIKAGAGVKVGGVDAAIESWTDTEIEFIVPAGAPSDAIVSITATTPAGKTVSSEVDITPPNTYKISTDIASDRYPCWGPGAHYIYFCSTRSGGANWDIYRIPATGGEVQRATYYEGADFYPDVNLSSGEVAWSSTENHLGLNPDEDFEIFQGYLVGVTGGNTTKGIVTRNVSRDLDPAWSPSVFAGYNMASTWEQVEANGSFVAWRVMLHGQGPIEELTEGRQPNFSGDGRWVVYNLDDDIWKIETMDGVPVQLTDTGRDWYPHWGQANDKIVFQRVSDTGGAEDIMVMNADGSDVQEVVATRNAEYSPSWSPDCTKIVYCGHRGGNFDIYVFVVP